MIYELLEKLNAKIERLEKHIKPLKSDKLLTYAEAAEVLKLTPEG